MRSFSFFKVKENEIEYVDDINSEVFINGNLIKKDFKYPKAFEKYKNKIYISDSYNNLIKVFDESGKYIFEFGRGILKEPYGIKILNDKIFVANKDYGTISCFDLNGNLINESKKILKQASLIEEYKGNLYVIDTNLNKILIFDEDLNLLNKIGKNLSYPLSFKIYNNYIYIADSFNKRIIKTDFDGNILSIILENEYYSLIDIKDNILFAYDEKNRKIIKKDINEEIKLKENYYNYLSNGKIDLIKDTKYLNEEFKEENLKIAKLKDKKEFYEYILQNYENKEEFYEKLKDKKYYFKNLKNVAFKNKFSEDKIKFIYTDNEYIYVSLFGTKSILKLNSKFESLNYYNFNFEIDKFCIFDNKILAINYYSRDVYFIDLISEETLLKFEKDKVKAPSFISKYEDKIVILDPYTKEIKFFNFYGKNIFNIKIEAREAESFRIKDKKIYVLDKKNSFLYIYDIENKDLLNKIKLENSLYPQDFEIDEENNLFLSDEGNKRILKYDRDFNLIFKEPSFSMPNNIVFFNKNLLINDYGSSEIKIYDIYGE